MKSLSRSFMHVFYPAYASFRGIFALMIGVICKTGVLAALKKLLNTMTNVTRLGLRGVRILFRRFGKSERTEMSLRTNHKARA